MNKREYQKAGAFLTSDAQQLKQLFSKARELAAINQLIKHILPAHLGQDCQVGKVANTELVLFFANAALATQVRLHMNTYLPEFKQIPQLASLLTIHCKVQPMTHPLSNRLRHAKKQPMALLSAETAAVVASMADGIADPTLQAILKRIAQRTK